jgi:cell division septum initiation protein DivIVA
MTITVQPTTTITVDGAAYSVDQMSSDVKQLIVYLDEWRQQETDLTTQILMVRAALRDIQNSLVQTLQAEKEAQAAASTEQASTTSNVNQQEQV